MIVNIFIIFIIPAAISAKEAATEEKSNDTIKLISSSPDRPSFFNTYAICATHKPLIQVIGSRPKRLGNPMLMSPPCKMMKPMKEISLKGMTELIDAVEPTTNRGQLIKGPIRIKRFVKEPIPWLADNYRGPPPKYYMDVGVVPGSRPTVTPRPTPRPTSRPQPIFPNGNQGFIDFQGLGDQNYGRPGNAGLGNPVFTTSALGNQIHGSQGFNTLVFGNQGQSGSGQFYPSVFGNQGSGSQVFDTSALANQGLGTFQLGNPGPTQSFNNLNPPGISSSGIILSGPPNQVFENQGLSSSSVSSGLVGLGYENQVFNTNGVRNSGQIISGIANAGLENLSIASEQGSSLGGNVGLGSSGITNAGLVNANSGQGNTGTANTEFLNPGFPNFNI